MKFFIANTFQTALGKLDNNSQKAAKMCAFDLQMDPIGKGKQFHRIDRTKEKDFWSVRASRDIRLIIHKTANRFTLCYVDHHDEAYDWAERRVFETHPKTGALQIVELVERVEEAAPEPTPALPEDLFAQVPVPAVLPGLVNASAEDLLTYGVPERWVQPLLDADGDRVLELSDHLPDEASEAVLALLIGETPTPAPVAIQGIHPDEQRRFRVVDHIEELENALDFPMEKWAVFLHPSQRRFVDAVYSGPARVAGSAGTGKTVVALHRAVAKSYESDTRVLLTTFSRPLAAALKHKVRILSGDVKQALPNLHIVSFLEAASDLHELQTGRKPNIATGDFVAKLLSEIAPNEDQAFLITEWRDVIDAWQVSDLESYLDLKRTGRRSRVSRNQRERLWPVFEDLRKRLSKSARMTEAQVFAAVEILYAEKAIKPYTHIIVDEAQDLSVAQLKFLRAISESGADALFFAGDLGQRIFQLPFSWASLGIDVRGRSGTLRVNYRTSHQVREVADRLLPEVLSDLDGLIEDRRGTVSVFNGPKPLIVKVGSEDEEQKAISAWVRSALDDGIEEREIGIIVRSDEMLARARGVVESLSLKTQTLTETMTLRDNAVPIGTMQYAKGLEFRCVAVMACDDAQLPLRTRLEQAVTEHDLDEVYATERQLFYVACTRARERLLISGVKPVSDYFADF